MERNTITTNQYKTVLTNAILNKLQFCFVGAPGIGKTKIFYQVVNELIKEGHKIRVFTEITSIKEPVDYSGLPFINQGECQIMPMGLLKEILKPFDGITIIFLDDLGQCPAQVQNVLTQYIEDRKINGFDLPGKDTMLFMGATNDKGHKANVNGLAEQLKSRFDGMYYIEPDINDWSLWAYDNDIEPNLIAFMRSRPEYLVQQVFSNSLDMDTNPRNIESASKVLKAFNHCPDLLPACISGCCGMAFAIEYMAFIDMIGLLPSQDSICLNPGTVPVPEDIPNMRPEMVACVTYVICSGLVKKADTINIDNIFAYVDRLEPEFQLLFTKELNHKKQDLTETDAFQKWIAKNAN